MEKQRISLNVELPKLSDAELMQKYVIDFDKEAFGVYSKVNSGVHLNWLMDY